MVVIRVEAEVTNPATRALPGLALALAMSSGPCVAGTVTAVYAVSWAGLDVGRWQAQVDERDGDYLARWSGATTGLIGSLFPFTSEGSVEGRSDGADYRPRQYGGRSAWRDGDAAWRVSFGPDGRAVEVDVPVEDSAEREPVPPRLRIGPDPASLALNAIAAAQPGARLEAHSYDGRRAISFVLACDEVELTTQGAGDELTCSVASQLLAGASRRWRERAPSDVERQPVRIWLQRAVPGYGYWPVRLEAPSRFGTVTARLVSVERPAVPG